MKVKVTKKMTAALNAAARAAGAPHYFKYFECPPAYYRWHIRDDYMNDRDYDAARGVMKTIVVRYPDSYYACDVAITTNDLVGLYRAGDTVETYTARVVSEYEI